MSDYLLQAWLKEVQPANLRLVQKYGNHYWKD
jgi:hypothetical protein